MALIIFFVLFTSIFLFYHLYYKRQKLPPGPVPLPFLGNLLQIHRGGNAEDVFLQWRRQFGPIYTFWMGQIPVVCVAEYAKIVDTFVRDGETYAGRYTMPFEHETLRIANILPNNVLHALTREVTVDGFKLPKGIAIVPQVSAVLIDDAVFSEPTRFKPERFLEQNGANKSLARCDELIPFSVGKRQCLGESMARMELFLFIANIFNQYKVSPGKTVPSLQRNKGAVVHCSPFTCQMEKRKVSLE
uniref:Cytochrome n=1 Tax=Globodera pallida TaxID=36090 RepID=A0A183CNJ2_GLOPA